MHVCLRLPSNLSPLLLAAERFRWTKIGRVIVRANVTEKENVRGKRYSRCVANYYRRIYSPRRMVRSGRGCRSVRRETSVIVIVIMYLSSSAVVVCSTDADGRRPGDDDYGGGGGCDGQQ